MANKNHRTRTLISFQVLDIEPMNSSATITNRLALDPEWLCVLSKTDHLLHVQRTKTYLPSSADKSFVPTAADYDKLRDDFSDQFDIPDMFERTAAIHQSAIESTSRDIEQMRKTNPQTKLLCLMLGIRNPLDVILNRTIKPLQIDSVSSTN
jgi:hypothetical protein